MPSLLSARVSQSVCAEGHSWGAGVEQVGVHALHAGLQTDAACLLFSRGVMRVLHTWGSNFSQRDAKRCRPSAKNIVSEWAPTLCVYVSGCSVCARLPEMSATHAVWQLHAIILSTCVSGCSGCAWAQSFHCQTVCVGVDAAHNPFLSMCVSGCMHVCPSAHTFVRHGCSCMPSLCVGPVCLPTTVCPLWMRRCTTES